MKMTETTSKFSFNRLLAVLVVLMGFVLAYAIGGVIRGEVMMRAAHPTLLGLLEKGDSKIVMSYVEGDMMLTNAMALVSVVSVCIITIAPFVARALWKSGTVVVSAPCKTK